MSFNKITNRVSNIILPIICLIYLIWYYYSIISDYIHIIIELIFTDPFFFRDLLYFIFFSYLGYRLLYFLVKQVFKGYCFIKKSSYYSMCKNVFFMCCIIISIYFINYYLSIMIYYLHLMLDYLSLIIYYASPLIDNLFIIVEYYSSIIVEYYSPTIIDNLSIIVSYLHEILDYLFLMLYIIIVIILGIIMFIVDIFKCIIINAIPIIVDKIMSDPLLVLSYLSISYLGYRFFSFFKK